MGDYGLIEEIDMQTGAVVAVQESMDILPRTQFIPVQIDGREVLVQSGVDQNRFAGMRVKFPFSAVLADVIVQKVAEGASMRQVSKTPGFPDAYTLAKWRKESSEFDHALRAARAVRAESLRDDALEIAREANGDLADYVAGKKLAVETLKWAAEKDDPGTYGATNKLKVEGSLGVVQLIVETGIRRGSDVKVVDARDPGLPDSDDKDAGNGSDLIAETAVDISESGSSGEDSLGEFISADSDSNGFKEGDEADAAGRGRTSVHRDRGSWCDH